VLVPAIWAGHLGPPSLARCAGLMPGPGARPAGLPYCGRPQTPTTAAGPAVCGWWDRVPLWGSEGSCCAASA